MRTHMGRLWQRFAFHPYRNWLQNYNFSEHLVAEGHALREVPQNGDQVLSKDGTNSIGAVAEAHKSTQGRRMIRARVMTLVKDSIYNLTGLVRTFPLQLQDLESLENQFTYYTQRLSGNSPTKSYLSQ